jgi:Ca2+-binding EF-hand superfamily protein
MASGGRKNKLNFKARASKSLNCCSLFEPNEIQELKEAFNMIDHDKDGFISEQDLKYMLSSLGNIESTAIITEMMSECTGPLNFTMFLSLFAEKIGSSDPESVILNAFSMFDSTDKGFLFVHAFQPINLLTFNNN